MKINEFTQLDELTMPGSLANKLKKGFLQWLKDNNVKKGDATTDMFQQYLGQMGIKSPGVERELEPMGRGFTTPGGSLDDTPSNQEPNKNPNPTTSKFKDTGKKVSDLNTYFQNFTNAIKNAKDKQSKINLAKELVHVVADKGKSPNDKATAKSILKRFSQGLDNSFTMAAQKSLDAGKPMENVLFNQFLMILAENQIKLSDIVESGLTMSKLDQLVKIAASDAKDNGTGPEKQPTNMTGAFISNFRRGMKGQVLPGRGVKAVGDFFKGKADDYEKQAGIDGSGKDKDKDDPTLTRGGLNAMKSELGLENPAMAVRAIQKLMNGNALSNKNELEAVKPLISAVNGALMDQQGRARLKQLFKYINK